MNAAIQQADFDARISRFEGTVDQMNARLTAIESRIDSGFRWIMGIQFTTLIALGTLILVKL